MIYWGRNFQRFFDIFIKFGAVVNIEHLKGINIGEENENKNNSPKQLQLL